MAGITKPKNQSAWMTKNKKKIRARVEALPRKKERVAILKDLKAQEARENPANHAVNCILHRKKSPDSQQSRGILVCGKLKLEPARAKQN